MLKGLFKWTSWRGQQGITGLETAIILIACVVVAAVFAYTSLSAGLFSTQKSQEAVYSGLKEARSTLELRGAVIATANATGASGTIKQISFTLGTVLDGEPIDYQFCLSTALVSVVGDQTQAEGTRLCVPSDNDRAPMRFDLLH